MMIVKRWQIVYCDMSPVIGSEQGGYRPVVILSNDIGNRHAPIFIGACITSKVGKKRLPTQVIIDNTCGLSVDSMVECEQIRTLDKTRIKGFIGEITDEAQKEAIEKAMRISLGL
jgi:mRNA interferase MazF